MMPPTDDFYQRLLRKQRPQNVDSPMNMTEDRDEKLYLELGNVDPKLTVLANTEEEEEDRDEKLLEDVQSVDLSLTMLANMIWP